MKNKMKFGMDFGSLFGGSQDPKNPKIVGAGNLPGGKYETLTISGAGKVDGNVEARSVSLSGAATINGDVKADDFDAKGSCTVTGRIVAKEFSSAGAVKAGRTIKAETFSATGAFSTGGDVDAETFRARGGFGVNGRIKADDIEIELNGRAEAKAIQGLKITVTRGASSGSSVVAVSVSGTGTSVGASVAVSSSSTVERILKVETVTGDTVTLEATRAKLVKGKRVHIGAECEIGLVEYSEELTVDEKAVVKEQKRKGG